MKVRMAGFEPAVSCARSTRNTRLSYILGASPMQTTSPADVLTPFSGKDLHGILKSAQRELNPRFLHGKQVGFRYIMGAKWCAELSMNKSTGWESNPRCRLTRAESSPLDDQCLNPDGTGGARTLTEPVKCRTFCR